LCLRYVYHVLLENYLADITQKSCGPQYNTAFVHRCTGWVVLRTRCAYLHG